jgi:hypothetical protein
MILLTSSWINGVILCFKRQQDAYAFRVNQMYHVILMNMLVQVVARNSDVAIAVCMYISSG